MIRRIQALNYRCLRHVDVVLDCFHVLVGPNASGKSTLFDVIAFLGDLVSTGLEAAVTKRTSNFQDLVWGRPKDGLGFELAVEFDIPRPLQDQLPQERNYRVFRYEVAVRELDGDIRIDSERGLLIPAPAMEQPEQRELFPSPLPPVDSILVGGNRRGFRTILSKSPQAQDNFNVETASRPGKGWATSIAFGHRRSTLGNLPESPTNFPVSTYVKRVLGVPSWTASDGTLRLLALTLPAYVPGVDEIYLLEEPENGIHPLAVDCVFQSLRSVYDSQVLVATHSPVVLRMAAPEDALCFAKDSEGATDIVRGDVHPRLRGWQGSPNMDVLFASGVIG